MSKVVALILARKGSKGVPNKNTKLLNGKPLISWTIEAATKSKLISRIIISTDDPKIVEICKSYGLEIDSLRPANLSIVLLIADTFKTVLNVLSYGYVHCNCMQQPLLC